MIAFRRGALRCAVTPELDHSTAAQRALALFVDRNDHKRPHGPSKHQPPASQPTRQELHVRRARSRSAARSVRTFAASIEHDHRPVSGRTIPPSESAKDTLGGVPERAFGLQRRG